MWITLSVREVEELGLRVTADASGLPPANPKFTSPAAGSQWQPDYGKYAPELAGQLRQRVGKAIYD